VKQQINLFQPVFRNPRKVFSALTLLAIVTASMLTLLTMAGYGYWRTHTLAAEVAQLSATQAREQQRLEQLRQQYPVRVSSPLLQQELVDVETAVGRVQALAGALQGGALGNTTGLSSYLLGFSRQHVDGTWLTHIEIADGGSVIGLHGRAVSPALIPEFVQRLAAEAVFGGKAFSGFELRHDPADDHAIEFSVTTDGIAKREDERG
jgi:hypothetical protein